MALGHGANIVRDGLVLHLDAANPKSYPGTGTVWKDLSGSGNNGTLVNGVGYSTDNKGSMVFDGVDDYADSSQNVVIDFTSFSISVWFKSTQSADAKIISNAWIYHPIQTLNGRMRVCVNGCTAGSTFVNDNVWRMATVTGNSTFTRLYLNNSTIPEISQSSLSVIQNSIIDIGKVSNIGRPSGTSVLFPFAGNISDVQIYNRALSAAEIKQNFEALRGRYGI
jgi:hypothetical protein